LKEFTVCYTFDNKIINEEVVKELEVKKEDVEKAIIDRMERYKFFNVKNAKGHFHIKTYLVRYVRITNEKILV